MCQISITDPVLSLWYECITHQKIFFQIISAILVAVKETQEKRLPYLHNHLLLLKDKNIPQWAVKIIKIIHILKTMLQDIFKECWWVSG